jgi:hypothetical protein
MTCHSNDAITQKLVHWASSQRDAVASEATEDDSDRGMTELEHGSDIEGVDSVWEEEVPFEGYEQELSLALTEGEECSGSAMVEAMVGSLGGCLVIDGVGDEGQQDLVPISVEPLAVAFPVENPGIKEDRSLVRKPSDWVLRREKAIGKVLGANYEGYEEAVTELLMDIEARQLQRKANMATIQKPTSSGRKGSRELKRLASSINYEARETREAKGKGKVQGGDAVVDQ